MGLCTRRFATRIALRERLFVDCVHVLGYCEYLSTSMKKNDTPPYWCRRLNMLGSCVPCCTKCYSAFPLTHHKVNFPSVSRKSQSRIRFFR